MSITVGIYELFAYTIPGTIFLYVAYRLATLFQLASIQVDLNNIFHVILAGLLAFLVGLVMNPVTRIWIRLFEASNIIDTILEQFKADYPELDIKFKAHQWPILFAQIKRQNMELANWTDRIKAFSIMLGSISFGFFLFTVLQLIEYFINRFSILNISLAVIFLVFSFLAAKQGMRFNRWFYLNIFEVASSHQLEISKLITVKEKTVSSGDDKK